MTILLITAITATGVIIVRQRIKIVDLRTDNAAMAVTIGELRTAMLNWAKAEWTASRTPADNLIVTRVDERRHFSA